MKGMRVELRMQAHRGRQETTHDRPMAHAVCQCLTSIPSTTTQRHRIPGNPQADTTSYRYAVSLFPSFIFTGSDAVRTVRYRYRPTSSTSYFQAGRDSLVVGRPPAQPSAQGRPGGCRNGGSRFPYSHQGIPLPLQDREKAVNLWKSRSPPQLARLHTFEIA